MAKFHNYHVLCPLIDQKSFLGITRDKEEECVIVTLGRNVVNRYRLSDQKQVGGWTSKDHITSAVIYNRTQDEYVGIFNNNTIKIWKDDVTNLDKVKKFKFSLNIDKLIIRGQLPPLLIFYNGNCASLTYAVDNRKGYESKSVLKDSESIVDYIWHINEESRQDYICYIIKNSKEELEILHCMLREEFGDMDKSKMSRVKVEREDVYVVGQLVSKDRLAVFVLWSDSKMTVYDLMNKTWQTIGNVHWISTMSKVSMAWMGRNHIILFGSNIDQDGAIIVAYNVTLGVASSRYPMKMYTENARLYCWLQRIMLEASNHIGVLPYSLETKRNLSSLLGSHEIVHDDTMEFANWDTPTKPVFNVPLNLKDCIKVGLTERSICAQTIPGILEKYECDKIFAVLREFNDFPESVLVVLVKYCIKVIMPDDINIVNINNIAKYCHENYPKMKDNFELFNFVLQVSFSDSLIIPHLRNSLTMDDTLFLLSYITYLLTFSDTVLTLRFETKLHDWCTLLMDAFHQHYLMTKDRKVTKVLYNAKNAIVNSIRVLHKVSYVMAPINKLLSGKSICDNEDFTTYCVELMEI